MLRPHGRHTQVRLLAERTGELDGIYVLAVLECERLGKDGYHQLRALAALVVEAPELARHPYLARLHYLGALQQRLPRNDIYRVRRAREPARLHREDKEALAPAHVRKPRGVRKYTAQHGVIPNHRLVHLYASVSL